MARALTEFRLLLAQMFLGFAYDLAPRYCPEGDIILTGVGKTIRRLAELQKP